MLLDEITTLLGETDTDDRRRIYMAWCRIGHGREIVPFVARAFEVARQMRGRESHVYYVTPYARFDDAAVELGLRALRDRRKEVRYRACGLLAHSRRVETVTELRKIASGPSREPAHRAVQALLEGKPFGADDDPFYFFYGHEPCRAPRGSYADQLEDRLGGWLRRRGFAPFYLFQHDFVFRDSDRAIRARWDGYDCESRVIVGSLRDLPAAEASAVHISGYGNDIAEIVRTVRALVMPSRGSRCRTSPSASWRR